MFLAISANVNSLFRIEYVIFMPRCPILECFRNHHTLSLRFLSKLEFKIDHPHAQHLHLDYFHKEARFVSRSLSVRITFQSAIDRGDPMISEFCMLLAASDADCMISVIYSD